MFEKEASDIAKDIYIHYFDDDINYPEVLNAITVGVQKGAEFGYRKANEWNTETPSSAVGNKDLLLRVAKDDFVVGYYHFENKRFYTNDGKEVTPLAWKEIHYPHESERMNKPELKDQLKSFEGYINDIPLVIDPCRMCKNHDDNKGFDEICSECCWFYDSKFEVKK